MKVSKSPTTSHLATSRPSMDFLKLANQLAEAGEPFALATVVSCKPPTSVKPGAKALIRLDGSVEGWVGGSCAHPVVAREARQALRDGKPRLVRLSPTAVSGGRRRPGVSEYLMTCHSGGTLEIFIEPMLPAPQLWVMGHTPLCRALARLGSFLGYRVLVVDPDATLSDWPEAEGVLRELEPGRMAPGSRTFVVVAGMGAEDEAAVETVLRSPMPYVALVASKKRAATLRSYLAERGLSPEELRKLKAPAGLDIGGETAEEMAVSIMAEIIQVQSRQGGRMPLPEAAPQEAEARDPVCGMSVESSSARLATEHAGVKYCFCSTRCKAAFGAEPQRYVGLRAGVRG